MSFVVAVVGAGVNGLCTAYHLARRLGGPRVVLLDRFPEGHGRGSSHGEERITRSSYASAGWVADMQRCHQQAWPDLEAALGEPLVVRGPGAVFFGPEGGPVEDYARAVAEVGADVRSRAVADARRDFPHMRFDDGARVLHDRTAGVIAAGRVVRGLGRWLRAAGVTILRPARVTALEPGPAGVRLRGEATVEAAVVVVASGPWIGELAPSFAVRPARQHVGYWALRGASAATTPAWVHLDDDGLHYGLPTLAGGEMKAAFHAPGDGGGDAPPPPGDDASEAPAADPAKVQRVDARLRGWFGPELGDLGRADTCYYTVHPDDAFVAGWLHDRVYALSACSGHAFKLAPLTGQRVAAAVLERLG